MKSVIIIDDQSDILELLRRFFSRYKDINIKAFTQPQAGLNYMQSHKTDLLITDITMPKIDGIELLRSIKTFKPDLHVVMMTAEASLERLLKSHKYDASDFLIKPIDFKELEQKIQKYLGLEALKIG